jgi:hypothetical protein
MAELKLFDSSGYPIGAWRNFCITPSAWNDQEWFDFHAQRENCTFNDKHDTMYFETQEDLVNFLLKWS